MERSKNRGPLKVRLGLVLAAAAGVIACDYWEERRNATAGLIALYDQAVTFKRRLRHLACALAANSLG